MNITNLHDDEVQIPKWLVSALLVLATLALFALAFFAFDAKRHPSITESHLNSTSPLAAGAHRGLGTPPTSPAATVVACATHEHDGLLIVEFLTANGNDDARLPLSAQVADGARVRGDI